MEPNEKREMRWVDAWNDAYEIAARLNGRTDTPCLLPDWSIVTFEDCLGWLQQSVYEGYSVKVEEGWVGHRRGVIAQRSKPNSADERPGSSTHPSSHTLA